MGQSVVEDPLASGREALDRHDWQTAYDVLTAADEQGALPAEGLRMLAEAAWWSGHPDAVIEVAERAYGAYLADGDYASAALMAFHLAHQHLARMSWPMASGWLARAERLVADDPDAVAHGYLAWIRGFATLNMEGDLETAITRLDEALAFADRTGDRNVYALSLHDKGRALCRQGKLAEGRGLMDEAMVAVVGGELEPVPTGTVYCSMIAACSQIGDYLRAADWTEATTRWCERFSITGFPGVCRVHRAEIMRLRGAWPTAEEEARQACEELPKFNLLFGMGVAFYEIGEIRRRMGDFAGAETAYTKAHEYGMDPEPGMSLLRLARGDLGSAAAGVRRALAAAPSGPMPRAHTLAAQAQIAIAAGDLETASAASDELDAIADDIDTTALRAMADCVGGAVRLAAGEPQEAAARLRRALEGWREINAPYEAAEVRVLLGKAWLALDDRDGALLELRAARDAYERLGATWDAERVGELLAHDVSSASAHERAQRALMFTDIVRSTDLVAAIGDDAWEDLLAWHDQLLRSLFASHGGEVAQHTGDGFFVTFDGARTAFSCAVAIQRALAEHRRQHGFAPQVRIAALAGGAEIVASADTVAEAGEAFSVSEPWAAEVKGLAEPLRVVRVRW